MICFKVTGYNRSCGSVTGGVSNIVIFDPFDMDFTQASPVSGVAQPYTAVALRAGSGATGTAVLTSAVVTSVTITAGGTLYPVAPTISFTGGGGTGATATAVITGGIVTAINVTAGGTGYTSVPTVVFSGGAATAAGGAKMFELNFQYEEAEWTWKQSKKSCSVKYDHEFKFQLPENSQTLTTFQQALDAAGCCCGIGMAVRLNNGRIFIAGERFVSGAEIVRFIMTQDGSDGTSGKVYDDVNGGNIVLKGSYFRNLYEYTGTWASITGLM